ncbi:NAD-dependent protein deacetylase sirtuin-1 isoform X2 [Linepithema humile]|uniref:NAD-dependent protein deacetylase sirtuin-1 isoform X2 n=1 Tax=Linepithema humile TaxID=83485 RepID=UPI00351F526F
MASSSELLEYSSPAKRRKVDGSDHESIGEALVDPLPGEMAHDSPHDDLEALGTDSGFNELSDESKSASISPSTTNLTSPPCRVDSTSNDIGCPIDTDEKDEVSSTVSNLSELSGLSDLSGEAEVSLQWRNSSWIQKQMSTGVNPRDLLNHIFLDSTQIPEQVDDLTLWKIIINMMSEPPRRQKLRHINTLSDVVRLIRNSKKIIVLTGAGVSVSCGIPDFRSRDGIYSRLAQDFPDLPDPQAMFDINYFSQDPRPFYKFAREIYPGQFKPSPCHRFIKMLDKQKKLLRNYSQNIDTLEQVAGIENVIECHGSFATASCTRCKYQVRADDIREDIFAQRIPTCPKCRVNTLPSLSEINCSENYRDLVSQGIMKPDIVFFGEGLPDAFHDAMAKDKDDCDLLIVIGSSLKVRPVALIPSSIPSHVPQILINREPLPHLKFDVELLGDGDIVINQICHLMGETYKEVCWYDKVLKEVPQLLRYVCDDMWEQSQDTITNTEMSRDSVEVDLKPHVSSTESQDSLLITANTMPQHTDEINVCVSPFHAGNVENTEESFDLLGESPKRRLSDTSIENSPKRMNFGNSRDAEVVSSTSLMKMDIECAIISSENKLHVAESTSENNSEECQVVPTSLSLSSEAVMSENTLESHKLLDNCDKLNSKYGDAAMMDAIESDKALPKPRQASVDSVLDSGIGDSCNSTDNAEEKYDIGELKNRRRLERRHRWHPKIRESLATRLPENSYYQLAPGRYVFPGAEVYLEPEDYDQCSLSANSESTDSDSDSSSVLSLQSSDEEETCADDDLSESADADADTDGQNNDAKWAQH